MDFQLLTNKTDIIKQAPELEARIRYEEHPFAFLFKGKLIAFGEIVFEADQSIEVKMLKVVEKKRGYGRMFIDYLKTLPGKTEIWGEAIPDAVPFWNKVGVAFEPKAFKEFIETDEYDEGFLIPFTIKL